MWLEASELTGCQLHVKHLPREDAQSWSAEVEPYRKEILRGAGKKGAKEGGTKAAETSEISHGEEKRLAQSFDYLFLSVWGTIFNSTFFILHPIFICGLKKNSNYRFNKNPPPL